MKIKSLKLRDRRFDNWHTEVLDHWDYQDMRADSDWRTDWISFDCLCHYPGNDTVYAGITSFNADIFWGYSRADQKFVPTGYQRIAHELDAKFHRSLVHLDGVLYGAIALLHDVDRFWDGPGGAIVRYDPRTNDIEKICIPIPHVYIQSLVLDEQRGIIYGQTFTPERLFRYDLDSGKARDLGPIGSGMAMAQGENLVLDDKGCLWGGWGLTRAWQSEPGADSFRLFRYDPHADRIEFLSTGLPRPDSSYGYAKVDALFNFGTGCLYASGANGSLYRIDPDSGKAQFLFTPIPDRPSRLSAMTLGHDGMAYGVVGKEGKTQLLRFDPAAESYELLGEIVDETQEHCWQVHDIVAPADRIIYAGENDVPHRSGYLWEISL